MRTDKKVKEFKLTVRKVTTNKGNPEHMNPLGDPVEGNVFAEYITGLCNQGWDVFNVSYLGLANGEGLDGAPMVAVTLVKYEDSDEESVASTPPVNKEV